MYPIKIILKNIVTAIIDGEINPIIKLQSSIGVAATMAGEVLSTLIWHHANTNIITINMTMLVAIWPLTPRKSPSPCNDRSTQVPVYLL